MHILILNWRDIRAPQAGGAEILTHEMARRWVQIGHEVTQISAGWSIGTNEKNGEQKYERSKRTENVDGVMVIRLGRWWNVHILAFFYYVYHLRSRVDVIIDEVHWFPFFAHLYAPKKTVLLACEVANIRFFTLFPYPVAIFWRLLEKLYLALYKNVPTMAISQSTKDELVDHGFRQNRITVLPMGLTVPKPITQYPKEKKHTIIYLGRLNKLKGACDALDAFVSIKKQLSTATLWYVGTGEESFVSVLKHEIREYALLNDVVFHGFVSEKKKFELLARAHVLIVPSVHEGWGLIAAEAAYVGTPAVVYDVPGLRDVVAHNHTGLLTTPTPSALSESVVYLLTNTTAYSLLATGAENYARQMSWDTTASRALSVLSRTYEHSY